MSILKLKDSQGNWVGVPTVKGDNGNGISSTVLNDDYTLTLTFTDGTTYTTPSIRGEKGEQGEPATDMNIHICSSNEYDSETRVPTITSPDDKTFYLVPTEDGTSPDLFTEWVYVNNAWEMFGSASVDLTDYVKNTDYATLNQGGVVKVGGLGITITNGEIKIQPASSGQIKRGSGDTAPINASKEHEATFYGLAKAAGHDEKNSTLPVGQYTDEAKTAIQNMLDVPSKSDIPVVNVDDVQINGQSIVSDGVANVPKATGSSLGVVKPTANQGISINTDGGLKINFADLASIKAQTNSFYPITPTHIHESAFYGLAKSAGDTTQSQSSNAVGVYTDNAKDKIQTMLGVSPLIAPHESDPFESAHVVGELFIVNGKLYRAKTALTAGEYINEGTNVEVVDVAEVLDDTYVKNTDYAVDRGEGGIVKVNRSLGISVALGTLGLAEISSSTVKNGGSPYYAISPRYQHESVFYGLAKASGDSTQSQSDNAVGTYTNEAKASIQTMLGVPSSNDVNNTIEKIDNDLSALKETVNNMPDQTGLSENIKIALLQIMQKIVYSDNQGEIYYNNLYNALYPETSLESITASFTQGSNIIYDTDSLSVLRQYLVVTAYYTQSFEVISDYVLTGELKKGTSTITVSYGGKSTTFTVNISHIDVKLYDWDLTDGLSDSIGNVLATTNGTQTSQGVSFTQENRYIMFNSVYGYDRTYQLDIANLNCSTLSSNIRYGRLFMIDSDSDSSAGGSGFIISTGFKGGDLFYNSGWENNLILTSAQDDRGAFFSGKTACFYIGQNGRVSIYVDGQLVGNSSTNMPIPNGQSIIIGSSAGDCLYNATFTGMRVYEGLVIE